MLESRKRGKESAKDGSTHWGINNIVKLGNSMSTSTFGTSRRIWSATLQPLRLRTVGSSASYSIDSLEISKSCKWIGYRLKKLAEASKYQKRCTSKEELRTQTYAYIRNNQMGDTCIQKINWYSLELELHYWDMGMGDW